MKKFFQNTLNETLLFSKGYSKLFLMILLVFPLALCAQMKVKPMPVNKNSVLSLSKVFKKYDLFSINTAEINAYAISHGKGFSDYEFEFEGYPTFPISIYENEMLPVDYKAFSGDERGKQLLPKTTARTYSGSIAGDGGSAVYLTLDDNLFYGMVKLNSKMYFFEPLRYYEKNANTAEYVLYEAADVVPHSGVSCGLTEVNEHRIEQSNRMEENSTSSVTGTCKLADVVIASDYTMMIRYGLGDVESHNIAVMNLLPIFYDNAQIGTTWMSFRLVGQYFSASAPADPLTPAYSGINGSIMLNNFKAWGQAGNFGVTYDIAQMWTAKDFGTETFAGSGVYNFGVIGLSPVGGTCSPNRYMLLEDYSTDLLSLACVAAHETGHNLGSNHDASGAPYIMAPNIAIPPSTTFSPASLSAMTTYTSGAGGNCFSTCVSVPPLAAFIASSKNVCTGSSISFTDYSLGGISRTWTFTGGNISTSTASNPTVSYSTAGIKSTKLSITGAFGLTSEVTKYITVLNSAAPASRTTIAGNSTFPVLQDFKVAGINKLGPQSVSVNARYNDYTCLYNTKLAQNTTYTVNFEAGLFEGSEFLTKVQVFIDYNGDGDFLDADENVFYSGATCYNGDIGASGQFSFTTPAAPATNKFLRLRLIGIPCALAPTNGHAIYNSSQVEDYAVYFPDTCPSGISISGTQYACFAGTGTYQISGLDPAVTGVNIYWVGPPGSTITSGQGTTTANISFPIPFTSGTVSAYFDGCDAANSVRTFNVFFQPPVGTITGVSNLCSLPTQTSTTTYSIAPVDMATGYQWTVPSGGTLISGQGTTSIDVSFAAGFSSGNIQVAVTSSCGPTVTRTLAISKSLPGLVSQVSGISNLCLLPAGTNSTTYSISPLPGSLLYIWSPPVGSGISSGQNSNSATIFFGSSFSSGTISLSVSGCGAGAVTRNIVVQGSPRITATAGAGGTISSAGISYICSNASTTYSITPDACYSIADVVVDGVSQGAIGTYTFTNVTANHTISTTFVGTSPLIINEIAGADNLCTVSGPTGYSVNAAAGATYAWTLAPGISILYGQGTNSIQVAYSDASFTTGTISVTVSKCGTPDVTKTISVSRAVRMLVQSGPGGSISPCGPASVCPGSIITYDITPEACFNIADVTVDGISLGALNSYTLANINFTNVNSNIIDHTITVSFSIKTYPIDVSAGAGGSVSPGSSTENCGSSRTYTITPDACYSIADVLVDGISQGATGSYTFSNITAPHSINATFVLNTYTITAGAGANGSITPATGSVSCGSSATYTITPGACYSIADVVVDGVSQGAVDTYTFSNVTATHTISATFIETNYTITVASGANGSISPATGSVNCGANGTYTITPNSGFDIADVIVDGLSQGAIGTYTFTNVTANHTISASFVNSATFTITSGAAANGTISPNGATVVNSGTNQSYTITPIACYHVLDVLVDGISVGAVTSYTFTNVTANHTISASFAINTPLTVSVSGPVNVCPYVGTGDPVTYTATSAGATGFAWVLPPNVNIVSGTGTANLTVSFGVGFTAAQGNKQIRVTALSPCSNSAQFIYYLVMQAPNTPQPIVAGSSNVCAVIGTAGTITYTILSVPGATSYNWSAQGGTTTINHPNGPGINDTTVTVSFSNGFTSSTITVSATSPCLTSGSRSLLITRSNPSTPGLISGSTNACAYMAPGGMAATYSVAPVPNATSYTWTVPAGAIGLTGQGTNTISFTYPNGFVSGSISVTATNGCGTGGTRTLAIGKLNPATPAVFDIVQVQSCPERIYTYTLATMASNATSVHWVIPVGSTLVSGQGTTGITVSYPGTAVNSTVTAQSFNNCGSSTIRVATVKLPACATGRTDFAKGGTVLATTAAAALQVNVYPNPTVNDFKLQVLSSAKEKISIRIMDLQGRELKQLTVTANQTINIGADLNAGTYVMEVRQANSVKTVKVIKFL